MSKLYCYATTSPTTLEDVETIEGFICYRVVTFNAGRRMMLRQRFKSYSALVDWLRKRKPLCTAFYYELEDSEHESGF